MKCPIWSPSSNMVNMSLVWVEEANTVVWYLSIVEKVSRDNIAKILHLKRSDKKGLNWIILDESEKLDVDNDQIVARDISVIYL